MLALVLLLTTWLGAGVALNSASEGLSVAANITLWWSIGSTIITAITGVFIIGLGMLGNGLEGLLKMGVSVIISLILWSCTGIGAALCLTTSSPGWIALGIFLWLVSLVSEVISIIGFIKSVRRL